MWPWWDQDEDPPHVLISLRPSDGTPPLVLRIQDDDPDPSNASDAFTMSLEVRDYNPLIPPVPAEPPSSLAPIRIGATGGPDPVHLEYPTNGPTANSLKLLLMGGRDNLGEHLGLKKLFVPTGTPGQASASAFSDPLLTSEQFGGLFVFENTRLEVKVIARDNRWKRVGPSGSMAGSYSTDPIEEARQILPEDPRSLARPSGESDPPYLDIVPRNELDNGRPGIAWWVEEAPRGSTDETAVKVSSPSFENAPHVLFRVANYPPDGGSGSDEIRRTDFFLRVVARDLLANVTDVRIPVYVKDKSFAVSTLESGSERKR